MRVLRGNGTAVDLDDKTILYFTTYQNIISVHTHDEEFVVPTSLDQLLRAYRELDFDKVDRSFIVNLQQVETVDDERKAVVFREEPEQVRYIPVSESNMPRVKHYVDQRK